MAARLLSTAGRDQGPALQGYGRATPTRKACRQKEHPRREETKMLVVTQKTQVFLQPQRRHSRPEARHERANHTGSRAFNLITEGRSFMRGSCDQDVGIIYTHFAWDLALKHPGYLIK